MKADLSPLELEEAVQDVCIKLQTRKVLAQLRAASTPRGYLVRMLRNAAIDRLRQDVRGLRRFERDLPLADTVGCYSLGAAPSDTALPDAVAQLLSDEERALFRECYVLRRPIGEIAASRGISPSAANGRLRRLRERLRAMKDGSHMRKRKTRKRNVNLERLRAAGEANGVPWGVSWNQIAERAKVEHSTITRLRKARSATRAVRAVTLERLAGALHVPAEWLAGERDDLPYVPERLDADGPSLWERPTADYVRYSWLMQRVEKALRRNLDAWYGAKANDEYDSWGRGVVGAFGRLAISAVWRSAALEPVREASWASLWHCDDEPSLTWLMQVLEPWFAGTAYLNTTFLRAVLHALRASPDARLFGSESGDEDAMRGLDKYAAARREFAPDEARFEGLGPEEP